MTTIKTDATNVSLYVYFVDDDGGTAPGEPTTGKLFSDIETGGSASFMRQGAARVDFALITLASASATHADGGFILVDDTNMPGLYRVDVPDAAFLTGVDFVVIQMVMASANNSIMRPLLVSLTETVVEAVWDEVLTGATHNVVNSSGRRLRVIQESGSYSDGHVYIDTVNGTVGDTKFENGVDILPVKTVTEMNTILAAIPLSRVSVSPNSTLTLAASQENQEFHGESWTLDLSGEAVGGSHFEGAEVSGIGTCATEAHFEHCELGTMTIGIAHFDECDIEGTVTLANVSGTYRFFSCMHSGAAVIDFGTGSSVNTTVHIHHYSGALTIENLGNSGTDVLHFDSPGGILTLAASCVAGTVNFRGTAELVNSGSGMTINRSGADVRTWLGTGVAASTAGTPDVNTERINNALVIGDGNATPWDGA